MLPTLFETTSGDRKILNKRTGVVNEGVNVRVENIYSFLFYPRDPILINNMYKEKYHSLPPQLTISKLVAQTQRWVAEVNIRRK